ncbi:MAG: DUF4399 domain-containing protein [Proteobacteria bacterium]|nr:MAG: DUF4399 domain-containing protein [Pseudomonadota bacterium]
MKIILMMSLFWLTTTAAIAEVNGPGDTQVYFMHLQDGDEVTSPVKVVFGLKGMGVAPAGVDPTVFKHVGHHHLFINSALTADMAGQVIPADNNHLHFGGGQTETTLNLKAGTYQLRLVLADPYHRIHQPIIASKAITIYVREDHYED